MLKYDKEFNESVFTCNTCDNILVFNGKSWKQAYKLAKKKGWTTRKRLGIWTHYCCRECLGCKIVM